MSWDQINQYEWVVTVQDSDDPTKGWTLGADGDLTPTEWGVSGV